MNIYNYECQDCHEFKNITTDICDLVYIPPREITCQDCGDTMVGKCEDNS